MGIYFSSMTDFRMTVCHVKPGGFSFSWECKFEYTAVSRLLCSLAVPPYKLLI